jgi:SLT domain-containing protein
MKMIRIARAESGFDQYAKNPNSTAKGIFQFIDGTWRANCLKDGNVYNFVDNINCAWKVYQKQGDRPWNASKSKWSK